MVQDDVLSMEGELEVEVHGADSKDGVVAAPYLDTVAFLAMVAVVPCCGIPSRNHCRTHLKTHLVELLKIVLPVDFRIPGILYIPWSLVKLRGIVNPWFLPAVMNIIIFWSTPSHVPNGVSTRWSSS